MGYYAKEYGADHGHRNCVTARQVFVEHDYSENDTGQTPWTEPAHEEFFICFQFHSYKDQKYRKHPYNGKTEYGIKQTRPTEMTDRVTDYENVFELEVR